MSKDHPNVSSPSPEVREVIAYLSLLSDDEYARALASSVTAIPDEYDDVVMGSPEPISKQVADEAFRSPDLLERSLTAVQFQIARTQNLINPRSPSYNPRKAAGRQRFLELMGRERHILGSRRRALATLAGGGVDNSPNPKKRAMERLWQLNLAGDVEQGMGRDLLAEEEERVAAKRAAAREERRKSRRRG